MSKVVRYILIGRKPTTPKDLILSVDPEIITIIAIGISRTHALLELIDTDIYITDLNSTNGTFIKSKREGVKNHKLIPNCQASLKAGDKVILGCDTEFMLSVSEIAIVITGPNNFQKIINL